jgi:hypothetical protein
MFSAARGTASIGRHPPVEPPLAPSGIPAIQYLTYSQNVAGLWLKYGAKPRNKGLSLLSKILLSM